MNLSQSATSPATPSPSERAPAWGAVFALSLGVAGLVASELLPVSLLTPMAADLGISEGLAGQAVTATAVVALVASLLIAVVTRRMNRRVVLLAFSVLLILSNLLVAVAPNLPVLLVGRMLLGIGLGGFWALAAAVAMRLVPEAAVPRALSIIFGGVSVATIVAAPLGSYLGGLMGWRNVFLVVAGFGVLVLVGQALALPSLPPSGQPRLRTLLEVVQRPRVGIGLLALSLVFGGHFAFFTYLRPFLETVTGVGVNGLSAILLGFGIANFVGTSLAGPLLARSLRLTLGLLPLLMTGLAAALVVWGGVPLVAAGLVALWGLAFATVPVGWSTWLTRAVPDEAESGGGLLVAAIQLAITLGAAAGGIVFDHWGAVGAFTLSGGLLLLATLLIFLALRPQPAPASGR